MVYIYINSSIQKSNKFKIKYSQIINQKKRRKIVLFIRAAILRPHTILLGELLPLLTSDDVLVVVVGSRSRSSSSRGSSGGGGRGAHAAEPVSERLEELDGHWKYNGGVLLGGDVVQRLQVAQLNGTWR